MILVDDRIGSKELQSYFIRLGIQCQILRLEYGDACFEGNGPDGVVTIGVERKGLSDILNCVEDARFVGHQLPGMRALYNHSFLAVEGRWEPSFKDGTIFTSGDRNNWYQYRPYHGARPVLYSKLYRYLISLQLSGVMITLSHSLFHTAYNIAEIYHYFQKPWHQHTSLREIHKPPIPTMTGDVSLVQKWATSIEGIGVELSEAADRRFHSAYDLAHADEVDWTEVHDRVNLRMASRIVQQVRKIK